MSDIYSIILIDVMNRRDVIGYLLLLVIIVDPASRMFDTPRPACSISITGNLTNIISTSSRLSVATAPAADLARYCTTDWRPSNIVARECADLLIGRGAFIPCGNHY